MRTLNAPKRLQAFIIRNLHVTRLLAMPEVRKAAQNEFLQLKALSGGKVGFTLLAPKGYFTPFSYLHYVAEALWGELELNPEKVTPEAIKGISTSIYGALQYVDTLPDYEGEDTELERDYVAEAREAFYTLISGYFGHYGSPLRS